MKGEPMFDNERYNEIASIMKYKEKQSLIAMSNKYFKIFDRLVDENKLKKAHVAYTFSYMYLMTYLFRYTKYEDVSPSSDEIKQLLMYSPTNKTINYITKKDGLLDSEKITTTLFDFPVVHTVTEQGELEFTMLSSLNNNDRYGTKWREVSKVNYNQSCKYPVLAFHKDIPLEDDYITLSDYGGTFYRSENTTIIPFEIFMYCMSHSELGTVGFYLYSYIAYRVGLKGNCQLGIAQLANNCNMSVRACQKYLNTLRQYNLIHTIMADKFIIGDSEKVNVKKECNTHFHNQFDDFIKDGRLVQLEKPNFVNVKQLEKYSLNVDTIDFWRS